MKALRGENHIDVKILGVGCRSALLPCGCPKFRRRFVGDGLINRVDPNRERENDSRKDAPSAGRGAILVHRVLKFGNLLVGFTELFRVRRSIFGCPGGEELERSGIDGAHRGQRRRTCGFG
jgi:hypothetical protein